MCSPFNYPDEREHIAALIAERDQLKKALWKIAHPITAMIHGLEDGERLNEYASMLAEDANYLKDIARRALEWR